MNDKQLQAKLDRLYRQKKVWEASFVATGSYTARCNAEALEDKIERLKREGVLA